MKRKIKKIDVIDLFTDSDAIFKNFHYAMHYRESKVYGKSKTNIF